MTPQELKNSILQLAVQGKLVEQRPDEGTAEELFRQIQAEKQKLIKEGKIKKEKNLPEITEDEIPFEIPESWKWVRLKSICSKIVDGDHNPPAGNKNTTEYMMLSAKNINNNTLVDLESARWLTKDIFNKENERTKVQLGDVFLTTVATLGRSCVFEEALNITFQRSVTVITALAFNYYVKYIFDSAYVQNYMVKNASGTAQKGFYLNQTEYLLIPLPPLAEQKRIVAKIEELLPLIERYEQAWTKLEAFNKCFPDDMQKSVLQIAIQGKLVEQRPEEGTGEELYKQIQTEKQKLIAEGKIKKEKPLPEITDDEIPFEIPDCWKWVRWGELSQSIQYGYNAPAKSTGRIRMVRISDIQKNRVLWDTVPYCDISEEEIPNYLLETNDILFARTGGTVGKSFLVKDVPYESIYAGYLIRTRYSKLLIPEYLKFFMESQLYWSQLRSGTIATAQPNCNGKTLSKMILPLPPLAEQKRIVQKLDEILPLCEKVKIR